MSLGFTPDDQIEIISVSRIINCDNAPLIPDKGWTVEEHRKGGRFPWNPRAVELYLSPNQQGNECIEGHELCKELANKRPRNANVLDWLLRHQDEIPESWKVDGQGNTLYIYFWGTIYRDTDGDLCVRYLFFRDGRWQTLYSWLDFSWRANRPAVVYAG